MVKLDSVKIPKRSAEILGELEGLILSEGFARLSASEIAASLRCSKRTLYELAPSKKMLVLLALDKFFSRIRQEADDLSKNNLGSARLVYEYLQVGEHASERLSQILVADIAEWKPARILWQQHIRLRIDGLFQIIDNGVKEGVFRQVSPAFMAEIVFAGVNRLREPDFNDWTGLTIAEGFHELYLMLLHALISDGKVSELPVLKS